MIPTVEELIELKVEHNSELYFEIEGIRNLYPDLRFPPDKIKRVLINGTLKNGIQQQDLHELTPFDKNLIKLHGFGK